MEKTVEIHTDYITLGQLLKLTKIIQSGGEEKSYLAAHKIKVNGVDDNRRGRKIRPGDKVETEDSVISVCSSAK